MGNNVEISANLPRRSAELPRTPLACDLLGLHSLDGSDNDPGIQSIIKSIVAIPRQLSKSPWSLQVLIKVSSNGHQLYPISFTMMMHTRGASNVSSCPSEFCFGHKTQHHTERALICFSISPC
jgi:hypothetical protein